MSDNPDHIQVQDLLDAKHLFTPDTNIDIGNFAVQLRELEPTILASGILKRWMRTLGITGDLSDALMIEFSSFFDAHPITSKWRSSFRGPDTEPCLKVEATEQVLLDFTRHPV